MTVLEAIFLALAGFAAGGINAVVGSGSLITFPVLLAMGYPPVLANVTNNIGVLPGSLSGSWVYRRHFLGQGRLLVVLVGCAAAGGALGAVLLLNLPAKTFDAVVPVLIIFACLLVVASPWIKKRLDRRRMPSSVPRDHIYAVGPGSLATAVYGGYFGAAQGIILLSLLSTGLAGTIHRANAFKNVLGATANLSAAVVFVSTTPVAWPAAAMIAAGALLGGHIGASAGQKIPPAVYRAIIFLIGGAAVVYFYA
ncbi:UPF0721 transmembrane protein HI_0198 [Arthrobacter sp. Hiyo4]|nr:UPF0721 transmembrane protein HI_0198 [Arthrobacter sp. Hiyo4]